MKVTLFLIFSLWLISCGDNNNSSNLCEPNPCESSLIPHKTECKLLGDNDFECICESGYFTDNGSCKKEEVNPCEPNPCTEDNKTICIANSQTENDYACECDEGFFENEEANTCDKVVKCEEDSCTEDNKTVCSVENNKIICSCKPKYEEDEQGLCKEIPLSESCNMPIYKEIFDNDLKNMELINKLHEITGENYSSLGYDTAKDYLFEDIDMVDGQNQCVYSGRWHSVGSLNCEHTWPQSQLERKEPMKSDLHHLYTTENRINSSRGHLRFANIIDHVDEYSDFDDYGQCDTSKPDYYCSKRLLNGGDDGIFEPADQHKGNVARAIFYFAVRWGNMSGEINDVIAPFINEDMKLTLIKWNKLDPVDDRERLRNDKIEGWIFNEDGSKTFSKLQGNRNPFIDCPELLDRIDLENMDFPEEYETY